MTYKKARSRKKRLACAHKAECFYFFILSKISKLSCVVLFHARASRFFRCSLSAAVETPGGLQKGAQAPSGLKPLFPRYLIGVYVTGWAVG